MSNPDYDPDDMGIPPDYVTDPVDPDENEPLDPEKDDDDDEADD